MILKTNKMRLEMRVNSATKSQFEQYIRNQSNCSTNAPLTNQVLSKINSSFNAEHVEKSPNQGHFMFMVPKMQTTGDSNIAVDQNSLYCKKSFVSKVPYQVWVFKKNPAQKRPRHSVKQRRNRSMKRSVLGNATTLNAIMKSKRNKRH